MVCFMSLSRREIVSDDVSGYFVDLQSKLTDAEAVNEGLAITAMPIKVKIAPEFVAISTESTEEDDNEECLVMLKASAGRIEVFVWILGDESPVLIQDLGESGTMIPSSKGKSAYNGDGSRESTANVDSVDSIIKAGSGLSDKQKKAVGTVLNAMARSRGVLDEEMAIDFYQSIIEKDEGDGGLDVQ
jgi:hypothetical protein